VTGLSFRVISEYIRQVGQCRARCLEQSAGTQGRARRPYELCFLLGGCDQDHAQAMAAGLALVTIGSNLPLCFGSSTGQSSQ